MSEEPGGSRSSRLLRALVIVVVAVVVLWLLFTQVFPRVEHYLEDPTLGAPSDAEVLVTSSGRG